MAPDDPVNSEPLHSQFGDDPDMTELVQLFVSEMSGRAGALRDALSMGDTDQLRRMIGQIKGAAGGYGFPEISDHAERLEQCVQTGEAHASALTEQVEALIQLCRRACA